jgi:ankyrin repeat protein
MKDKEGSTPICFAFRSNNQDIIDLLTKSPSDMNNSFDLLKKINMDIVCPKFGCPLHLCILKHKFTLASKLLTVNKATPHITNPNGSNAMHILFANYHFD